jgi:hypothetical protein
MFLAYNKAHLQGLFCIYSYIVYIAVVISTKEPLKMSLI